MPRRFSSLLFRTRLPRREGAALFVGLLWGSCIGVWAGILAGATSAAFLWALDRATQFRVSHPLLLWGLPLAGIGIAAAYSVWGKSVEGGNNLLLERLHSSRKMETVPLRMVPLIFATTVATHFFGGSAGREGVATQMGGTLSLSITHLFRFSPRDHKKLLRAGISGGFGAVFGTPLAGCWFGLEVQKTGRIDTADFVPCFIAACVGDVVCRAFGIHHAVYTLLGPPPPLTPRLVLLVAVSGVAFGLAAAAFSEGVHVVSHFSRFIKNPLLRPVLGGVCVIGLTYLVGTNDYLGLSLPLIARALSPNSPVVWAAFAWKLGFTVITLGTGYKGGEVTPLFCIGATLGATLAHLFHAPPAFFAALGFVAVFGAAANTPLACVFMGIELFGAPIALPLTLACFVAYLCSGHRGIYTSQMVGTTKAHGITLSPNTPIGRAASSARVRLPRLIKRRHPSKLPPK